MRSGGKLAVVPDIKRGPLPATCTECPFAVHGKPSRPVPGEGAEKPLWIALGEGPGTVEALEGRPFVGPSGRMVQRVLDAIGANREDIWITNTTLCQPRGSKTDKDLAKARECCAARLQSEFAAMPGVPVLTMGAVAAHALLGDEFSLTELAGSLNTAADGRDVIATHHPARILRGGDGETVKDKAVDLLYWNLLYDAAKIDALGNGNDIRFSDDIDIEYSSPEDGAMLMGAMAESAQRLKHMAIDVETDGLDGRKVNLTSIAVATTEKAISLKYPECWPQLAWILLRELCADPEITKVFHNRQFDELMLTRYGVVMNGPVQDTMLKHHAAFPGASHKLQDVATQFFAIQPWKAEFRKGADTVENLLRYNARDALVTARLDPVLDSCIEKTQSRRCYEIDNALAPIARQMEIVGIPIDRQVNLELRKHFEEIIARTRKAIEGVASDPAVYDRFVDQLALIRAVKARKQDPTDFLSRHAMRHDELKYGRMLKKPKPGEWVCAKKHVGHGMELLPCEACKAKTGWITPPKLYLKGKEPVEFSLSNPDHVAALLKARGHHLHKLTAGGKPSTSKDILEELAYIEDVRTILDYREAAKLYSTFVVGLPIETDTRYREKLNESIRIDNGKLITPYRWGRLHSSWNLHLITGRWASYPNVQNWPKANMRGRPNLRRQVVAPPGRKLVGADFAQLEARIIGLLSGDPLLVAIFMEGFGECEAGCVPGQEPVKFCPRHDIHTVFAVEVFPGFFNYNSDERKELRDLTKRGEYGGFYGAAVETMYQSIVKEFPDVTLPDVARILQIITAKMPGVAAWHAQLARQAMAGEIRTAITGRRRAFPLGNAEESVVKNFPVQGTGADIVDLGILALVPKLPDDAHLIVQGHDSVVLDVREEDADAVARITTAALSQSFTINGVTMDFPANATTGDTWAEL